MGFYKKLKNPDGDYQADAPWYYKFNLARKQFTLHCQTHVRKVAEGRAKAWRAEVTKAHFEKRIGVAERMKLRNDFATVEEVLAIYMEAPEGPAPTSRARNRDSLRIVVSGGSGGRTDAKTSELDKWTVRRFVEERMKLVGQVHQRYAASEPRVMTLEGVRQTISSRVTQARAVFANLEIYERKCQLPDLKEFLGQKVQAVKRGAMEPPDAAGLAAVFAAAPALKRENPRMYAGFLLVSQGGLRSSEAMACRRSWVEELPDGGARIGIILRKGEFKPKGTQRFVSLAPDVWREIKECGGVDYLVGQIRPAQRRVGGVALGDVDFLSDRQELIGVGLVKWVKQYIRDRDKVVQELRRHAGSKILDRTNNPVDAQRFLGHSSLKTTMEWYAYRFEASKALPMMSAVEALPMLVSAGAGTVDLPAGE
jgi:integrase